MITHKWQVLVAALAGWVNHQQQDVINYILEENKVLKKHLWKELGGRRFLLTDAQRRRSSVMPACGRVKCHKCLGGLLRFYHRRVA